MDRSSFAIIVGACVALAAAVVAAVAFRRVLCRAGLQHWLIPYARSRTSRRAPKAGEPVHVLLCVADHYEPGFGNATDARAAERVARWVSEYPRRFGRFRDSDGRTPRHTFFYPPEHYRPELLDDLAGLCRAGFGEVELHLHHDGDTSDTLRKKLVHFRDVLHRRHGMLARHRYTGELAWGFVHGDWALDNSHPDGRHCGVDDELTVLRETGCYADFTFPSAPDPTQPKKINSIYYAVDDPRRPRSHDVGVDVGVGTRPPGGFMLIQGPLLLDWGRRKFGIVPRIENGYLQRGQHPSPSRLDLWLRARVQVPMRPDWLFVKLHAHGATEWHAEVLLGESMERLHEELARRAARQPQFQYHYVTAREMYNLARAAEGGWRGSVADALDYELIWNGGGASVAPESGHADAVAAPAMES
jgi:hypothetical protein